MIAVILAATVAAWLGMGLLSDRAPAALRGIVFTLLLNLSLLIPVHVAAALNLATGLPLRAPLILAAQLPLLILATLIWRRARLQPSEGSPSSPPQMGARVPHFIRVAAGLLIASYVVFAAASFSGYPSGWDGLVYHLPLALRWLQQASLRLPASLVWQYSMPGNGEILMMLGLGTGLEQSATAFNLGSLVLLALGIYLLALRLSGERQVAWVCAMIALSMPIVEYQVFSAYIDIYAAAFLLAGLVVFLHRDAPIWTAEGSRWVPDLLAGLAFGVAVGSKLTAVAYAGLGGVLMAAVVGRQEGWPRATRFAGVLAFGLLCATGFWLLRAWTVTGNPLFPLEVRAGNAVLLQGIPPSEITPVDYASWFVRSPAEWLVYPWTEWHRSGYSYGTGQGFGAAFATFVPIGLAYLLLDWLRNRRRLGLAQTLLLASLLCLGVWWFAMHQVPRFALPVLAVFCALAAPLLARLLATDARLPRLLLPLTIATTVAISTASPALSLARRWRDGQPTRAQFYGLPALVDSLAPGTRLLNLGVDRYNYGMAGPCMCNRIIGDFEVSDTVKLHELARVNPAYVVVDSSSDNQTRQVLMAGGFRPLRSGSGAPSNAVQLWTRPIK